MISTRDNCVFVHIPKVAGQSIESVFLERANLTWQQRENMLLRHNEDPKLGPPRLAHLTAQEYISLGYLSSEAFNNMVTFTFVRNPWDRLVSEYLYRKYPYSFKDFLYKFFPKKCDDNYAKGQDLYRHVMPQVDFILDKQGNSMVDYIGKFENLTEDFANVTKLITGKSLFLPHKNKTSKNKLQQFLKLYSSNKQHYSSYYDDESQLMVANLYQQDIVLFNYTFERLTDQK